MFNHFKFRFQLSVQMKIFQSAHDITF